MNQQWSHDQDVSGVRWARYELGQRNVAQLIARQYPTTVASRDDAQRARVLVSRIEVDSYRDEARQRLTIGFSVRDSTAHASARTGTVDWKQSVLMTRYGPVCVEA